MNRIPALVLIAALLLFTPLAGLAQDAPDDSSNVIAAYAVKAGDLLDKPAADHKAIWSAVRSLVPGSLLKLITKLEFFQVPDNPEAETATDGYAVLSDDGAAFTLGLNIESAKAAFVDKDPVALPEYQRTIIHEFGHVLSFQASQMDQTGSVTDTLVIDEGTLKPGAYLNQFHQKFWKTQYPGRDASTGSDAEGKTRYDARPNSFVTEYAATGPLEDFAESFAWYVAEEPASGSQVKDQKLKFFTAWPELVALRDAIHPLVKARVTAP